MSSFKDHKGTEWKLCLTSGAIDDVLRDTGVNLAIVDGDASAVDALFQNRRKVVEVLWVLCEEQAAALNVQPEKFGHRFDRGTLQAAGVALQEEIADFFYPPQTAAAIKKKLAEIAERQDAKAAKMVELVELTDSHSPTNSAEFAGSTPEG